MAGILAEAHLSLIIHNNKIVDTKPYTINSNKDIIITTTETLPSSSGESLGESLNESIHIIDQQKQPSTSIAPLPFREETKLPSVRWALFKENSNTPSPSHSLQESSRKSEGDKKDN